MDDPQELAQVRAALEQHAALGEEAMAAAPGLWRDYDIPALAAQWQRLGVTAEGVRVWVSVRAFSPWAARELAGAGVPAELAAQHTDVGVGPPDTVAFKYSARQVTLIEALAVMGVGVPIVNAAQRAQIEQRSERLEAGCARVVDVLEDLRSQARGTVYPASASEGVFAARRTTLLLAEKLSALAQHSYRELAGVVFHDELERHEDASVAARAVADTLDELAQRLQGLHDEDFAGLARGALAPGHFGLRIAAPDGRDPNVAYGPDAR